MAVSLDRLEFADAWCDAMDYKADILIQYLQTKDPVKKRKLDNTFKKADRICNRLAKSLCQN